VAPFAGDVAGTLRALRERVFRDREYRWHDEFEEDEPRPATIEGIWASEEMRQSGTLSILDVDRVAETSVPASWDTWREDLGTVRPLAPGRAERYFGTARPSREQFEALIGDYRAPGHMDFIDEVTMRGTGRYIVLYKDEEPAEVGFSGESGD
jgi:hypothetical protein